MKKTIETRVLLLAAVLGSAFSFPATGQVLFSDNFDSNTASQWKVLAAHNNTTNTTDYRAVFSTNYGSMTYRFNGTTRNIPPAPRSVGGTTKGLYTTVNKETTPGSSTHSGAVNFYPVGQSFSGNYALRFDMFTDYNGDIAYGGVGSTEFGIFGLNHSGNAVNWTNNPSDGVFFGVTAEGGTTRDYRAYIGPVTQPGVPSELIGSGGFLYSQNANGANTAINSILPAPPGQTPGAPGKQWVTVELKQVDGNITWLINGFVIASHAEGAARNYTNGNVMIGYMDPLAGVANPPNENYAIFDNVEVASLEGIGPVPTVQIFGADDASEPNDTGMFTINLVDANGSQFIPTNSVSVNLKISGSASNGVDYTTVSSTIVFPAGLDTTNIMINPINDSNGEPTEILAISIAGSTNSTYELRQNSSATINLNDDGDVPTANIEVLQPVAYEGFRQGKFNIYLSGTLGTDTTVNYTIGGTATNNVDYTNITASVVIPAGFTNATVSISPINDSLIESNETVILTIGTGSGYGIGTLSNATVTIRSDDLSTPTQVLLFDSFDTDSSPNWYINPSGTSDTATFAYDYSADGIPLAPHSTNSTTKGVKLEANITEAVRNGISLSPKGVNATGDYRIRMDVWMNYNGDGGTGLAGGGADSTEWFTLGVGTTGDHVVWDSSTATRDAIWFDCDGDGSSTVAADFEAFKGSTSLLLGSPNAQGVWVGGSQASASPYYAEFNSVTAPETQINNYPAEQSGLTLPGSVGFAWHDMVVTKQGTNVTWTIDGLPVAVVDSTGFTFSTNVFFGYYDGTAGISPIPELAFAIVDNFRVESLTVTPPTTPEIESITVSGGVVMIDFTGGTSDSPSSFTILSTTDLGATFTTDSTATASISQLSPGSFHAMFPVNGAARYYRIRR